MKDVSAQLRRISGTIDKALMDLRRVVSGSLETNEEPPNEIIDIETFLVEAWDSLTSYIEEGRGMS